VQVDCTIVRIVGQLALDGFMSIDTHETAKVVVTARTRNPLPQQSPVALHAILEGDWAGISLNLYDLTM
jgi:hypothetical protein